MKSLFKITCYILAFLSFRGNTDAQITGFSLPEGEPEKTFYVSPGGKGDGSSTNPYGSIQQALKAALEYRTKSDKNVKVLIRDGIYREQVTISDQQTYSGNALLILEAERNGEVTISGAKELKNWRPVNERDRPIYWTILPDDYITTLTSAGERPATNGRIPNPWPNRVKTLSGMWINGQLKIGDKYYLPVPTLDSMTLGSFYIDYQAKRIYAKLFDKVGLNESELALLPSVFNFSNNNNFIMRGINVVQAGWSMSAGARFNSIDNLLVEDCKFNYNRYMGVGFSRIKNGTFRNVEMCHNGGKGGGGSWSTTGYLRNVLYDRIKVNYNNWINYQYGWYSWDPCGIKFAALRQVKIKDSEFVGNYATGLWLDTEFRYMFVENTVLAGNFGPGVYLEASKGPTTLVNCNIYNNDIGVYISASELNTLDGCNIHDNNVQISVFDHYNVGRGYKTEGQADFADIDNHGEWRSHAVNAVITNCQIYNSDYNETPLVMMRGNDTIGYRNFMNTLKFENNKLKFGSSPPTPFYYKPGQKKYPVDIWRKDQGF